MSVTVDEPLTTDMVFEAQKAADEFLRQSRLLMPDRETTIEEFDLSNGRVAVTVSFLHDRDVGSRGYTQKKFRTFHYDPARGRLRAMTDALSMDEAA